MSRYLGIKRTWVLLGLVIAAGFLLSACDEETRSRSAIFEEQSRVEGEATSSIDATPAELSTPTPLPTITLPPTSTPTPTRPRSPTPTRAPATPTPTSVPVSTPETDAENEVVPTPTPVPGERAEDSSPAGSATSTTADLGPDSDAATSTIILAKPAPPPLPIREIALSGVRMTTNRPLRAHRRRCVVLGEALGRLGTGGPLSGSERGHQRGGTFHPGLLGLFGISNHAQ